VPQWDFLDFIAQHAAKLPNFRLLMETKAERLIEENGAVVGVQALGPDRLIDIRADLVVAADGRHSTLRDSAGLQTQDVGAPIDVLWFRVPRDSERHPNRTGGILRPGAMLVMLNRQNYWQCAFVIPKGSLDEVHAQGLVHFRRRISAIAPFLSPDLETLTGWDDVKLLSVQINDLPQWSRPGLLCIGDAAHAMSPVGGVGINLAIQDAVATANLLAAPLRERRVTPADLAKVQRRRQWPARVTQRVQVAIQNAVLAPTLARQDAPEHPPAAARLLQRFPLLRRLPARLVGIGVRPERVRT
jgi:2-polyprenyl-6-methoxyphenol hydroxylase-like FAD-dependent oxidoreductase